MDLTQFTLPFSAITVQAVDSTGIQSYSPGSIKLSLTTSYPGISPLGDTNQFTPLFNTIITQLENSTGMHTYAPGLTDFSLSTAYSVVSPLIETSQFTQPFNTITVQLSEGVGMYMYSGGINDFSLINSYPNVSPLVDITQFTPSFNTIAVQLGDNTGIQAYATGITHFSVLAPFIEAISAFQGINPLNDTVNPVDTVNLVSLTRVNDVQLQTGNTKTDITNLNGQVKYIPNIGIYLKTFNLAQRLNFKEITAELKTIAVSVKNFAVNLQITIKDSAAMLKRTTAEFMQAVKGETVKLKEIISEVKVFLKKSLEFAKNTTKEIQEIAMGLKNKAADLMQVVKEKTLKLKEVIAEIKVVLRNTVNFAKCTRKTVNDAAADLRNKVADFIEFLQSKFVQYESKKADHKPVKKGKRNIWLIPLLKELLNREKLTTKADDMVDTVIAEPYLFGNPGNNDPLLPLKPIKVQEPDNKRFSDHLLPKGKTELYSGLIDIKTQFIDVLRPVNDNLIKNGLSPPVALHYPNPSASGTRFILVGRNFSRPAFAFYSISHQAVIGFISAHTRNFSAFHQPLNTHKPLFLTSFLTLKKEGVSYV